MTEVPVKLEGFGPQDLYQRREKIFTRAISGFYQKLRLFTGWPLLIGYFGLPWLMFDGRQAVLFDLPARQFHIFGLTIWPQDLWLLGWLLMISAFALFTVTTVVGRLWCGYSCPQTVWTAIFMWIEQVTEGSRHQRIRLDAAPWSFAKVRKRATKHAMWATVAVLTGLTFVGYFAPIRELVTGFPGFETAATQQDYGWLLFWVAFFSLATYINAGWLREQVCIYMCPYARFQSAMIDADTLTVSYDKGRGEPRGSRKRGEPGSGFPAVDDAVDDAVSAKGDCIDCTLCQQVCPTGIDIRDGLQYECIGCAQCIDACDQVMQQMNYPTGLIRYTSERALAGGKLRAFRLRSISYGLVTALLCGAFGWALLSRASISVDIIRERGALYQLEADGRVRNDYQLIVMNKSQSAQQVEVSLADADNISLSGNRNYLLQPGSIENLALSLIGAPEDAPITPVKLTVCNRSTKACAIEDTSFFRPASPTESSAKP